MLTSIFQGAKVREEYVMNGKHALKDIKLECMNPSLLNSTIVCQYEVKKIRFHISGTTVSAYLKRYGEMSRMCRPPMLLESEEQKMVETLLYFAYHSVHMTLAEMV